MTDLGEQFCTGCDDLTELLLLHGVEPETLRVLALDITEEFEMWRLSEDATTGVWVLEQEA